MLTRQQSTAIYIIYPLYKMAYIYKISSQIMIKNNFTLHDMNRDTKTKTTDICYLLIH